MWYEILQNQEEHIFHIYKITFKLLSMMNLHKAKSADANSRRRPTENKDTFSLSRLEAVNKKTVKSAIVNRFLWNSTPLNTGKIPVCTLFWKFKYKISISNKNSYLYNSSVIFWFLPCAVAAFSLVSFPVHRR